MLHEPSGCSGGYLEALEYEGGDDMRHLSALLRGLGDRLLDLRPRQDIIVAGQSDDYGAHVQAAMARGGDYALIYDADGGELCLDLSDMADGPIEAQWLDPRSGAWSDTEPVVKDGKEETCLEAPSSGEDWVLKMQARSAR